MPAAPSAQAFVARRSTPSITPTSRPSILPSILPGVNMNAHSVMLSGVAGYVEAAGFTALLGLFPAHVTGEIVSDAVALSSGHFVGHLARIWMLPVFVASVVTATLVARVRRRNGQRALTGLLLLVTAALGLFSASDAIAQALHAAGHLRFAVSGGCAVAAMGIQNALMRECLLGSCPTTVMTGNLTHVVIDIVDHVFHKVMCPHHRDRKPRSRLAPVGIALAAFVACAVLAGFLTRSLGTLSVTLPTLLTLVMTVRAWREDRKRLVSSIPALHVPAANLAAASVSLSPAPLPTFDIWPDSLLPRAPSNEPLPRTASTEPGSVPAEHERPPMKRTISGTQLKRPIRDAR
ncbi:MAG: YoaK family protein [Polyangiaceae bacterium]